MCDYVIEVELTSRSMEIVQLYISPTQEYYSLIIGGLRPLSRRRVQSLVYSITEVLRSKMHSLIISATSGKWGERVRKWSKLGHQWSCLTIFIVLYINNIRRDYYFLTVDM